MGKNWKGGQGGSDRGGRGRGGRGDRGGRGGGAGGNDLGSCRGHGVVIGTCDAAREKETSKELVNLFTMLLEDESLFPRGAIVPDSVESASNDDNANSSSVLSIKDMLAKELSEVRGSNRQSSQPVRSIQTGVKGITCIKIMRRDVCPLALVKVFFISIYNV